MRKALDLFYGGALCIAAAGMICILAAVTAQILGRLLGVMVPSTSELAGYSMAASSFMALASTFRSGGHIRVSLLIANLGSGPRLAFELFCLLSALAITAFFFGFIALLTIESYQFGRVSGGVMAIPLWMPQTFVSLGLFALCVGVADELVMALRGYMPRYTTSEAELLDHTAAVKK